MIEIAYDLQEEASIQDVDPDPPLTETAPETAAPLLVAPLLPFPELARIVVALAPPTDVATIASAPLMLDVLHPLEILLLTLLFPRATRHRDHPHVQSHLDEMTVPALQLLFLLVPFLDPHMAVLVFERKHHRKHPRTHSLARLDRHDLLPVAPLPCEHHLQVPGMAAGMVVSLPGR